MFLYYTVSSQPEDIQSDITLSIGGFKSSVRVPNGSVNNLFSDISIMTVANYNANRYIGLVLKNETGINAIGVKFWFEFPEDCYSNLKVAAVDMSTDENGNAFIERVNNVNTKPVFADFVEADGQLNEVDLGDIANGEMIGIWVEQIIDQDAAKTGMEDVYEAVEGKQCLFKEKEKDTEDEISIKLSW